MWGDIETILTEMGYNYIMKLYRKSIDKFEYWETWEKDENSSVVHFGLVGEKGETINLEQSFDKRKDVLKSQIKEKVDSGFRPIAEKNLHTLILEYETTDNPQEDFTRRTKLESRLNELLGWTGLGHCDGGTSGKNTLEIFCLIVDYDLAYKTIVEDLNNSEFADYLRINKQ
jgi:hypothetical protein